MTRSTGLFNTVFCSECVAVCCSVLSCVAVHVAVQMTRSAGLCETVNCSVLQYIAVYVPIQMTKSTRSFNGYTCQGPIQ